MKSLRIMVSCVRAKVEQQVRKTIESASFAGHHGIIIRPQQEAAARRARRARRKTQNRSEKNDSNM
jgi:hypothetical protein